MGTGGANPWSTATPNDADAGPGDPKAMGPNGWADEVGKGRPGAIGTEGMYPYPGATPDGFGVWIPVYKPGALEGATRSEKVKEVTSGLTVGSL